MSARDAWSYGDQASARLANDGLPEQVRENALCEHRAILRTEWKGFHITEQALPSIPAPEDRRQHLDFIQAAIARMSAASAVAKGWALTIATAAFGYAGTQSSVVVALLGMFAVTLFATVDARYLREERKYRLLFDGARVGAVDVYEMNAKRYCGTLTQTDCESTSWGKVVWSWSVRDYYGLMLLVGVALLVWLHCR